VLSAPACLSVFCEFWRSMITTAFKWEPLLFMGVADVAAFFGYFFGLQQKSNSPAVRIPQTQIKSKLQQPFNKTKKIKNKKSYKIRKTY
jgi:hypothetical protein